MTFMTHKVLLSCLQLPAGKSADIKRCHQLRGALPLLDFDDDASIGDLKGLLLRAAFAPPFLRLSEGRRLLSSLFNLQVSVYPVQKPDSNTVDPYSLTVM